MNLAVAHSPHSAGAAEGRRTLVGDEDDIENENSDEQEEDQGGNMPFVQSSNGGGVFVANAQLAAALSAGSDADELEPDLLEPETGLQPEPNPGLTAGQTLDLSGNDGGGGGKLADSLLQVPVRVGTTRALDVDEDESPVLMYAVSVGMHARAH